MSVRATVETIVGNVGAKLPAHEQPSQRGSYSSAAGAWDGWSVTVGGQIQNGLNLRLPMKSPAQMPALGRVLEQHKQQFHEGILGLRYVHFARFVPEPDGSALWVITSYDGDVMSYLMDFVGTIADVFNAVLIYIAGCSPLPIQDHPREFAEFVLKHNLTTGVLTAYPQLSALEVLHSAGMSGNTIQYEAAQLPSPTLQPVAPPAPGEPWVNGSAS